MMLNDKTKTKPLQLRKMTQGVLRWNNFLVRKSQRHYFNMEGSDREYSLALYPKIESDEVNFIIGLLVEIDGIPAPLWLSAWPMVDRIREYVSEHKIQEVPLQLRVELIESALRPLLSYITSRTDIRLRIINFLTLKPTQVSSSSIFFTFYEGGIPIQGMLVIHDKLRPLIERKLQLWPDNYNMMWDKHPTRMQLEVGYIHMAMRELYELELGDVLLIITPEDVTNQYLRVRLQSGDYFRAQLNGSGVNIISGVNGMSEEYSAIEEEKQVANINELPVRLTFDLGELSMPFEKIKFLEPDYIIDLNQSFSEVVKIRSENKLIGTGELVDINGKVGIRIQELFGVKGNG